MAPERRAALADGGPGLALLLLAALLPVLASSEYVLLAASMIVTAVSAASFNLLFGYAGMLSFGQAAFYGVGAYATGLLSNALAGGGGGGSAAALFFPALAGAVALAGLVGAASGAALVRVEGVGFVMLTFALAALLQFGAVHAVGLTGGDSGLIVELPRGLDVVSDVEGVYYATLALAAAALLGLFAFVRSRAGLVLRAIREDELRARTLGVAVERRKLGAFAAAAALAGLAGGLSVLASQIVYPDVFDWRVSANALIVTLLGGAGTFSGPLVGAVALGLIDFYVGKLTTATLLAEGAVLLAVVLLAPRGLVSLRRRRAAAGAPAR